MTCDTKRFGEHFLKISGPLLSRFWSYDVLKKRKWIRDSLTELINDNSVCKNSPGCNRSFKKLKDEIKGFVNCK